MPASQGYIATPKSLKILQYTLIMSKAEEFASIFESFHYLFAVTSFSSQARQAAVQIKIYMHITSQ